MTKHLSDQEFQEALGANPRSVQAPGDPARHAVWQAAQDLENRLETVMCSITAPAAMPESLLSLATAQLESQVQNAAPEKSAANDAFFWQRLMPTAALLMLALGMGWYFNLDNTLELQNDLFGHLYAEEPYYTQDTHYALAEVNTYLENSMGAHINANADTNTMDVTFVKDCKVAKQVGAHLVMQGSHGLVNIIVLPTAVVETETAISDEHFSGLMTPAFGRTLVVIGDKQETIAEYRNLLNSSLEWEY